MTRHPKETSCGAMADHLSDYLDGELREDLRALIDAHRGQCPPCEAFIRTLQRTVEAVRAQPREPLSAARKRALVQALQQASSAPK